MSTCYTTYIQDGTITTGKDFLKLCLRNFGIAADIKDEPLSVPVPTHFEPSPHFKKSYDEVIEKRDKYKRMTFEEARQELTKEYNDKIAFAKELLEKYKLEDERYKKVRDEVKKWIPPTDEYDGLKIFALNQINMSMNTYYYEYIEQDLNEKLDVSDSTVFKYINEKRKYYEELAEKEYRCWQEEIEQTAEKNMWMQQFLDSLENVYRE